jgi:hypothetical protein
MMVIYLRNLSWEALTREMSRLNIPFGNDYQETIAGWERDGTAAHFVRGEELATVEINSDFTFDLTWDAGE